MSAPVEVVALGEVLWDLLPSGKCLGGAPFNFAFHCHQLGHPAATISRLGRDALGLEARQAIQALGLSDAYVQEDGEHPTGTVGVALEDGQPRYTIHENVAYDHLAYEDRLLALAGQAQVVCFGTLAQRSATTRLTIERLTRSVAGLVICDINLRQHYHSPEVIESSLRICRWAKLNNEELVVLRDQFGLSGKSESALVADLRKRFGLELVALTRGSQGAMVQTADEEVVVPGVPVQVVDTVGAGDAFTAGLASRVLEGADIGEALVFANRLAARVAGQAGATPRIDRATL